MFWGFLAIAVVTWLGAVFFIVKGWGVLGRIETAIETPEPARISPVVQPAAPKREGPPAPKIIEERIREEEIEIPIVETPREEQRLAAPPASIDLEGFYRDFGRANVVEFPAEYIDRTSVKGLSGSKINVIEFAKNCYREIDFRCIDSIITGEEEGRLYRVNIFDLICDHYASADEDFIGFFGRLKDRFAEEIHSISSHPDITRAGIKALVAKYEVLPQLIAWNRNELFLVTVKSQDDTLNKREIDFFREFVIKKRFFKARIFKVIEKRSQTKLTQGEPERPAPGPIETVTRRPFTSEEIQFLKANKGRFTNEELAENLGRSVDSVTHKLSRLGISRESYEWTADKDNFLRNNIAALSYKRLAERLGTTVPSVRARCRKIDIKK